MHVAERRQGFMEQLLVPLGEELARLRVRFAPGQMRACFLGSLAPPGVGQVGMERQEVEELRVREQVLGLLLTFVGVVRHTIKADGHWSRPGGGGGQRGGEMSTLAALGGVLWRHVLPSVEDLLISLHSLWDGGGADGIDPRVYVPAELLVLGDPGHRASDGDCGDVRVTKAALWLRQTREACYELTASLAALDGGLGWFDYLAKHPRTVKAVFGQAEVGMENRHVRLVLRSALVPLLRSAPARKLRDILWPVLPGLMRSCLERLTRGYDAMAAARMVENGVPGAAALERFLGANVLGVVREGTLRLLHRDVVDVALALCNAATMSSLLEGGDFQEERGEGEDHMQADDEASSAAQPQSALQAFMQMECLDVLLKTLGFSMSWPDAVACGKAVEAAQRLLPRLQGQAEFDGLYVSVLFRHALKGLRLYLVEGAAAGRVSEKDDMSGPLSAFCTDVYVAFGRGQVAGRLREVMDSELSTSDDDVNSLNELIFSQARSEKQQRVYMRARLSALLKVH